MANAFPHQLVCNLVGFLTVISNGERDTKRAKEALNARDRRMGGIATPPDGLYLTAVEYPAPFVLPQFSSGGIALTN